MNTESEFFEVWTTEQIAMQDPFGGGAMVMLVERPLNIAQLTEEFEVRFGVEVRLALVYTVPDKDPSPESPARLYVLPELGDEAQAVLNEHRLDPDHGISSAQKRRKILRDKVASEDGLTSEEVKEVLSLLLGT